MTKRNKGALEDHKHDDFEENGPSGTDTPPILIDVHDAPPNHEADEGDKKDEGHIELIVASVRGTLSIRQNLDPIKVIECDTIAETALNEATKPGAALPKERMAEKLHRLATRKKQ